MEANGILTMVVGAVITAAAIHHGDPGATAAGALIYMGGLHWPRPFRRRRADRRRKGETP